MWLSGFCPLNEFAMHLRNRRRELVILSRAYLSGEALEKEVSGLNRLIQETEVDAVFCQAHELATRNHITNRPRKILNAFASGDLKPFHFLISRN